MKWRHAYPYVPTSYYYNHSHGGGGSRGPGGAGGPESIELEESGAGEEGEEERENWGSKWEFIFLRGALPEEKHRAGHRQGRPRDQERAPGARLSLATRRRLACLATSGRSSGT